MNIMDTFTSLENAGNRKQLAVHSKQLCMYNVYAAVCNQRRLEQPENILLQKLDAYWPQNAKSVKSFYFTVVYVRLFYCSFVSQISFESISQCSNIKASAYGAEDFKTKIKFPLKKAAKYATLQQSTSRPCLRSVGNEIKTFNLPTD